MLEIELIDEFYIFLLAIGYGLILGFFYDLYRVFRYYSRPKRILSIIQDLIFWLIVTLVFFTFLFHNTNGVVRGFVIIGFLIGGILYLKIISKYNFPILIRLFKLILRLIHEIISIILYPFRKIFIFYKRASGKVNTLIKVLFKDMKRYIRLISKKK